MMRSTLGCVLAALVTFLPVAASQGGGVGDAMVIARVNGEPITLEDFFDELAARHAGMAEGGAVTRQDPAELLRRLINVRLILQEARNIGLDELPEPRAAVGAFAEDALRGYLFKRHNEKIEVTEAEVLEELREQAGELRVRALYVAEEPDAARMRSAVRDGASFAELAAALVEEGKARGGDESPWIRPDELLPAAREALWSLEPGEVTRSFELEEGYAVFQLLDSRVPDDRGARDRARQDALQAKQLVSLLQYLDELIERHAEVDWELVDGLDYESQDPGVETLLQDERTIARLSDGSRITVADLTEEMKSKFFHGMSRAVEQGRVNQRKRTVLDSMLRDRVALLEAYRLGLQDEPEYARRVEEFCNRVLFATFVDRAIDPSIEVDEQELKDYLERHRDEFSSPERMRIETFGFLQRETAERTLQRLNRGADPAWVRANTDGQLPAGEGLDLGSQALPLGEYPADVRAAVAGARPGDYRFLAEEGGPYYVLAVRELVPSEPLPLEAVRDELRARLISEKRLEAVDSWADELRAASQVELLVGSDELSRLIGMPVAEGS